MASLASGIGLLVCDLTNTVRVAQALKLKLKARSDPDQQVIEGQIQWAASAFATFSCL